MKKQLLFVYPEMMLGGSTTSLISMLKSINYDYYEVDLLMYKNRGEYLTDLPKEVNILPEAALFSNTKLSKLKKNWAFLKSSDFVKGLFYEAFYKRKIGINNQIISLFHTRYSRNTDKQYDVAIGYLELWADYYVLQKVSALKKVIWIHIDYLSARFIPSLDKETFENADNIVCVSESCLLNFNHVFPHFKDKSFVFENILMPRHIKELAEKISETDRNLMKFNGIKLVTVCRMSIHTKGLDRCIKAAKKLKKEGYNFKWYMIGDGEDLDLLKAMISDSHLNDEIVLMGEKKNPYPYMRECDVYVMASRREGKPMAVTEAQILGLPIVVTNYSSAKEQVVNGVDGIIVENDDEAIYSGIKDILDNPDLIKKFKENILKKEINNEEILKKLDSMIL